MSIENLKKNIEQEKRLVSELENLFEDYEKNPANKKIASAIESLEKQIKIINEPIPKLVNGISMVKNLSDNFDNQEETKRIEGVSSFSHKFSGEEVKITIDPKKKSQYLKELGISEDSLKRIRKGKSDDVLKNEFKKINYYAVLSNKVFLGTSRKLIKKGYFSDLKNYMIKGNMSVLLNSYVSIILFTTLLSLIISFFVGVFFLFFNISLSSPFISLNSGGFIQRFIQVLLLIIFVPVITFIGMYLYPNAERRAIEKDIEYELPFVTIQMAAIAGSNIEPSNIFSIIALSKEHPALRKEAKKIINQINFYGYDLITALRNVSESSPSREWADLLNGISTTIRSGGDIAKYLGKRAESMLFEYKLKREKSTRSAETFMDIYISVVIAAPMLMMLLLIMLSITNLGLNLSISTLTLLVVSSVSLINVIFLSILQLNQNKF